MNVGDRVILPADEAEGWTAESGVIEGVDEQAYMVRVDEPMDDLDDCLREVPKEQVRRA